MGVIIDIFMTIFILLVQFAPLILGGVVFFAIYKYVDKHDDGGPFFL